MWYSTRDRRERVEVVEFEGGEGRRNAADVVVQKCREKRSCLGQP